MRWATGLIVLLAALPVSGLAHAPGEGGAHGWWSFDSWVLLPFLLLALGYPLGVARLWRRAGIGRGLAGWRVSCGAGGIGFLFLALIWPFEVLSGVSFAAHMTQHMLLMLCAAPLLALGMPGPVLVHALPRRWRPRLGGLLGRLRRSQGWRLLCRPAVAFLLHALAIWAWHAPAAFELALAYDSVHFAEHMSFLLTGMLFWWSLFRERDPAAYGLGALWMVATLIHTGLLGAIITFAQRPLYPAYADAHRFGLTLLEDQQLAGLIMWVPGSFLYVLIGLGFAGQWLFARADRGHSRPLRSGLS